MTAAVNRPQAVKADGSPVEWRAVVNGPTAVSTMSIDFTSGPASTDGSTGGDEPPVARGYDVANTDFFGDLNKAIPNTDERFGAVNPRDVIAGTQSLTGLKSLVLADDALPGYTGPYGGDQPKPTGPRTANKQFQSTTATVPGQGTRMDGHVRDVRVLRRAERRERRDEREDRVDRPGQRLRPVPVLEGPARRQPDAGRRRRQRNPGDR